MKELPEFFVYDYCCLRIPACPIEPIFDLNAEISRINLNDEAAVKEILEKMFSDAYFREALFIASKDLYGVYSDYRNKATTETGEARRFLVTFYKYFLRMSSRCTPYGIFAGVGAGKIEDAPTNIAFHAEKYRPVFQFNIHPITELLRQLNPLDPELAGKVRYFINNTLYALGDKIFFVEQFNRGGFPVSNLSSITRTKYVQVVLDSAKNGATIPEMAEQITLPEIDAAQKIGFINSLIKSQVLVSEFWPSVSTDNFMADFLRYAESRSIALEQIDELDGLHELTSKINRVTDIEMLRDHLKNKELSTLNLDDLFKVDLFYNLDANTINKKAVQQICDISYELSLLTEPVTADPLETFKNAFHNKYEEREIPLVKAIDPNYGVGYSTVINGVADYTPLVEGIPIIPQQGQTQQIRRTKQEILRRKAVKKFFETKAPVIQIDEYVAQLLDEHKTTLNRRIPISTYVFGSILAESEAALDRGDFKFVPVQVHAPFANRLLTRFTHAQPELREQARKIAEDEQRANPNRILAEVLTIPDGKYANISLYPTLRDYEIPYLSASKKDREHQIDINDLVVSVRNGRVILRSVKFNKEIVPYLSNTYNSALAQPIYKFLADVGSQDVRTGNGWDWGAYYDESYLPRIEYKNFILTRARWVLRTEKINYKSDSFVDTYISKIRNEYDLPRYVVFASGDNELILDLDNAICRSILAKEINQMDVLVYEYLHTPENCFIKENGKSFTNEILIPMGTDSPLHQRDYSHLFEAHNIKRIFAPGEEWLYVKIYSGSKILENVLTEVVGDFAEKRIENDTIDKWFFIRYNDPEYHIRVRFHRSQQAGSEWYQLLEQLQQKLRAFVSEEHAVKVVVDTYSREVERYGAATMESSENIFFADSVAVYQFSSLIYGNEGEDLRWRFALVSVDKLLSDFDYSLDDKKRLINSLSRDFINEFSHGNAENVLYMTRALNNKYRNTKLEIAEVISENTSMIDYREAYECFEQRSEKIRAEAAKMTGVPQEFKDSLMASYIHMALNRLFLISQRRHELVIYHYLNKFYESVIAQSKIKV